MNLELDRSEAYALQRALEVYLRGLEYELDRVTVQRHWRGLADFDQTLRRILARLEASAAAAVGGEIATPS